MGDLWENWGMKKEIRERILKQCAWCGKDMTVILYTDKSYRGGHYWGKIGVYSKKEMEKELKSSYKEMKILAANCRGILIFETLSVLNDFVCSPPRGKLEFSPTSFPLSAFIP
jgi:hypothetical protein